MNHSFARKEVKFEKEVVIFSSNNCHIAEVQADLCPRGYYFCDRTKKYSRDIYENARHDCDVRFGHLTVTLCYF